MLPDEIEKTLQQLGDDGDKVRGALERDFAAYAKQANKKGLGLRALFTAAVAQALMSRAVKAAGVWFSRTDTKSIEGRVAEVRERAAAWKGAAPNVEADADDSGTAGA
jgi:hypothetical protein